MHAATNEKKWWKKRKESEFAWRVSTKDIEASGFNLDIKNPNAPDDGPQDPDKLLAQYTEVLEEVAEVRNRLKSELSAALERAPE